MKGLKNCVINISQSLEENPKNYEEVICFSCTCVIRDTFSPTYLIHLYTANYFSAQL